MSNMRNMIEYFTDVNNLTKFVKVITHSAEYIKCEKSERIPHTYILPTCVTCKKFDRICHLWGNRSNTLQLWNYGKIDLIHRTVVTHLTENITYEKYVPVSHTYNSPKCVTCNTSDQIYLARDKFDRKLPCCKNNTTELFIVVTYLTKYVTCEKSDRISHTYISPKMFPFIKNLFTGVQAIEILMCDKLVWVKNSKSAKRISTFVRMWKIRSNLSHRRKESVPWDKKKKKIAFYMYCAFSRIFTPPPPPPLVYLLECV